MEHDSLGLEKHNSNSSTKDEELKDDLDGLVIQGASVLIDKFIGKYKTEDELKIGDRKIDELIEIK
jgi:hypothetical protein